MRAKRYGWRDITIRFACDRTTAWRRWQRAIGMVVDQLNGVVYGVGFWRDLARVVGNPASIARRKAPATFSRFGHMVTLWSDQWRCDSESHGPRRKFLPKINAGAQAGAL